MERCVDSIMVDLDEEGDAYFVEVFIDGFGYGTNVPIQDGCVITERLDEYVKDLLTKPKEEK